MHPQNGKKSVNLQTDRQTDIIFVEIWYNI